MDIFINSEDLIILISLFSMGFFGGFSHCVTMCGPFVITQVSQQLINTKISDYHGLKKLSKIALLPYHCGRITTYSIIGFFCAYLRISLDNKIGFNLCSGALILLACLYFINLFLKQNNLKSKFFSDLFNKTKSKIRRREIHKNPHHSQSFIKNFIKLFNKKISFLLNNSTGFNGYILGLILGLLPCGMLYGAFGLASSLSNQFLAFFGMTLFGFATFFALFFVGLFAKISSKLPEFKIIANIIIIINILMLFKMFLKKIS